MRRSGAWLILLLLAGGLLLGLRISHPYRHALAWRVLQELQAFVDRTLARGAAFFRVGREEYRRATRPRVEASGDQICVLLATGHSSGDLSYQACYRRIGGNVIEERATGPTFGATPLIDRLPDWLWW